MNLIPKEIKESLEIFKKSFKKLFYTTTLTSEINFSKIFENVLDCNCENTCIKNCNIVPTTEVLLEYNSNFLNDEKQDFLLSIKSLYVLTTIEKSLYCLCIYLEKENKNIILFKGLINDFLINKQNYSFPLKINLPNKIIFKIFLLDKNGNKYTQEKKSFLDMGVIDFGLTFL